MALSEAEQIELNKLRADLGTVPSLSEAPSREAVAQKEQQRQKTLGIVESVFAAPFQAAMPTSLPELGAMAGTMLPIMAAESRVAAPLMNLAAKAPAAVRPFVPTLAGSSIGVTAGNLAEQGLQGKDILSTETGQKILGGLIENAMYDIGGNLIFTIGGKTIKVAKDKLSGGDGLFAGSEGAARQQAQKWFIENSDKATLTKGQLTGDTTLQHIEGALRVAPGSGSVFDLGAKQRKEALDAGIADVMSTLETSDAFKNSLKTGVAGGTQTTQQAAGGNFQTAMTDALDAMKQKYRPVYESLDKQGDGLLVDLKGYKADAMSKLAKIESKYKSGMLPDSVRQEAEVLRQVASLDDVVPMSVAHEIRSDLLASARGLQQEGKATSAAEVMYNKAAAGLRNNMDRVAVITFGNEEEKAAARKLGLLGGIDQPSGLRSGQWVGSDFKTLEAMNLPTTEATRANNPLLRDYWNAQTGYKNAMEGLQDATIRSALKEEPRAVGTFLFDPNKPDRITAVRRALVEAQKYLPAEKSKGLLGDLQYGYLDEMFGSPTGLQTFTNKMQDKTFKEGFNVVFGNNKQLQEIANAAKYGLQEETGTTYLRTAAASAVGQAMTGGTLLGLSYLAAPNEIKDKFDPLQMIATGTGIILTPRLIAKALNNREAMTGLALLAKAQDKTKYGGSMAAKGMDMLNKSGVIDNEYLNDIQTKLYGSTPNQQQQAPMKPQGGSLTPQEMNELQQLRQQLQQQ